MRCATLLCFICAKMRLVWRNEVKSRQGLTSIKCKSLIITTTSWAWLIFLLLHLRTCCLIPTYVNSYTQHHIRNVVVIVAFFLAFLFVWEECGVLSDRIVHIPCCAGCLITTKRSRNDRVLILLVDRRLRKKIHHPWRKGYVTTGWIGRTDGVRIEYKNSTLSLN